MRFTTRFLVLGIPVAATAQEKVSYRNVELRGRDDGQTAIEFTLALPDSLATARVRAAGELRQRRADQRRLHPAFQPLKPRATTGTRDHR